MVISNISATKNAKNITLTADIGFREKPIQHAYFTISKAYETFICEDASPFLAALLIPCMKTRENIYIDGSVSETFLNNINNIMTVIKKGTSGLYKIKIRSKALTKSTAKPRYVGTFFTADVDSFYTYLKHKEKRNKITHLILPHGFDILLEHKRHFSNREKIIKKMAKDERIKIITIETNIGNLIRQRIKWEVSSGGAFAAVALLLRHGFKKVFIPSKRKNITLSLHGTYLDLMKLWSAEKLQLLSDGGEYDQLGKIMHNVGKSRLALKYLLVCKQPTDKKYNCSRCFSCVTTMISLVCVDRLHKAKTFDKELDLELVKKLYYDYRLKYNIHGENAISALKRQHREEALQEAIRHSLVSSMQPKIVKRFYMKLTQWNVEYREKLVYQFVFKTNAIDKNLIQKLLDRVGFFK